MGYSKQTETISSHLKHISCTAKIIVCHGRVAAQNTTMARKTSFVQELILYAISAAVSYLVLAAGLKHLDPNKEATKKASERKKEIAKRLGRPLIATDTYEDVIACDVVNPNDIDVTFDSIGGLENIKQELYEMVVLPLVRPNLFAQGKLLGPQKGVLLYGPPGTGKTLLAKALARESGAVFINVRIANLMSKWFGDAQKLVNAVFTLAHKLQPAIIFIDEVDSFLGQRRSTEQEAVVQMKTEFMALWDGFTTDQSARVMVLAATNRLEELDEAILRRFSRKFKVGMPTRCERAKILEVILKGENVLDNINYDHIARLCEGYSGSDLMELCKKAAYHPVRELLEQEKSGQISSEIPRPLKQSDLEKVLSVSRLSKNAASDYGTQRQTNGLSNSGSSSDQADINLADLANFFAMMGHVQQTQPAPDNIPIASNSAAKKTQPAPDNIPIDSNSAAESS